MASIKIYILTYKDPTGLNNNLRTLFSSRTSFDDIEVHIINNHSEVFELNPEYQERVIVHHQNLRADWGCGHPARDWNQAIVQGFKDLNNPACEQLILCQDDCVWDIDWRQKLDQVHTRYSLYQCSWGDCFISLLPDAIKKVGLFDERMCTLGYYEGDFLLRAWLYNRDKSSINDFHHGRVHNETVTIAHRADNSRGTPPYMKHSGNIFAQKWPGINAQKWRKSLFKTPPKRPAISGYLFYPYFEKDIENLEKKGYVIV